MPGNRDPFAAYICDDAALDVLRPVVIELGWQPEITYDQGIPLTAQWYLDQLKEPSS